MIPNRDVSMAVNLAVGGVEYASIPPRRDVGGLECAAIALRRSVYRAVSQLMSWAVNRAVYEAGVLRETVGETAEPLPLGLAIYLGVVT